MSERQCQRPGAKVVAIEHSPIHAFARMLGAGVLMTSALTAAEAPAANSVPSASSESDEMTIAVSTEEKEAAKRDRHVEFYKKVLSGDGEARGKWDDLKGEQRTTILCEVAVKDETSAERDHALRDLANVKRSDDPENHAAWALARVACADKTAATRELAQKALAVRRDDCVPGLLSAALNHPDGDVRENAIGAMKAIGGPRIFELLIQHWHESCGPGPHNHIFIGNQKSYISTYDVAGAVYDPVIKSFLTGVALDLKVQHIEGDVYYYAIREVTGNDVKIGNDADAWQVWLNNNRARLAQDAEKKHADAVAELKGK